MKWSLRRRMEQFLRRSRMPPTRFGMEVTRDPRLVFEIRRGRRVRPPMAAKIEAYLERAERGAEASLRLRRR